MFVRRGISELRDVMVCGLVKRGRKLYQRKDPTNQNGTKKRISERIMKEFDEKTHHNREEVIRLSGIINRIGNQVDRVETLVLDSMSTQVKVQTLQLQMAQLQSDQKKFGNFLSHT